MDEPEDDPRGDPDADRDARLEDERDIERAERGWAPVLRQWDDDAARLGQTEWR